MLRLLVAIAAFTTASAFAPVTLPRALRPLQAEKEVSIADDIAAAFGSMKNDYPELPFAMGFSGDKNEHQQDAWDLHMNKDGSIPPARVVSSSTVASATATATGSVSEKDENVVMETIATALAGGENDYPELPFPTGYSGEANNKFRDAFDYGMTKGSGKN